MVRDILVVSPKQRTKTFFASHPALSGVRSKQASSIVGATTVEQALRSTPLKESVIFFTDSARLWEPGS